MSVLLCDTERGSVVVRSRIKSGAIDLRDTRDYAQFEKVVWEFLRSKGQFSLICVDTLTTLATTTLLDVAIDPAKVREGSLWDERGRYTPSQGNWQEMGIMLIRLLRMIRSNAHDIPSIFTCHEGERGDPVSGDLKQGPDLNKMLLKDVYGQTDMVLRLSLTEKDMSLNGVTYKAGTRALRLMASPSAMAKTRVPDDIEEPPPIILEPTWAKLVDVFGGALPSKITLYGASGVGKTRFIGSAADYYATAKETSK